MPQAESAWEPLRAGGLPVAAVLPLQVAPVQEPGGALVVVAEPVPAVWLLQGQEPERQAAVLAELVPVWR